MDLFFYKLVQSRPSAWHHLLYGAKKIIQNCQELNMPQGLKTGFSFKSRYLVIYYSLSSSRSSTLTHFIVQCTENETYQLIHRILYDYLFIKHKCDYRSQTEKSHKELLTLKTSGWSRRDTSTKVLGAYS